jgi:hypothetical protein
MKCRIQFKGNILVNDLKGDESIETLKQIAKTGVKDSKFSFSDFRFKFSD